MMDLVEDDQGLSGECSPLVYGGSHADLRIRHYRAVEVRGRVHVGVAESGVEIDPDPGGGVGPLLLQVFGRRDDGEVVDRAVAEQLKGDPQRERRLAGAGRGDGEEILPFAAQILHQCLALPHPECLS
ncbi:hypothetical protein GCM10027610_138820 [Dactylosporangium cerinum]